MQEPTGERDRHGPADEPVQAGQPELLQEIRHGTVELTDDRLRGEREMPRPRERLAEADERHDEQDLQGEGGVVDDLHHHVVEAEEPTRCQAEQGRQTDEREDRDGEADHDRGRDGLRGRALAEFRDERITHPAAQPIGDASHSGDLTREEHLSEIGLVAGLLQAEQGIGRDGEITEEHQRDEPAEAGGDRLFAPGDVEPEGEEAEVGVEHRGQAPRLGADGHVTAHDIEALARVFREGRDRRGHAGVPRHPGHGDEHEDEVGDDEATGGHGERRGRGGGWGGGWGGLTKGKVRGKEGEGKWEVGSALRADLGASR